MRTNQFLTQVNVIARSSMYAEATGYQTGRQGAAGGELPRRIICGQIKLEAKRMGTLYFAGIALLTLLALAFVPARASAHCDTMDGPTAIDGKKALETGNINFALKWILPPHENELRDIFELSRKVRVLGPDARELADRYFLENLVRIHRAGEGAPFEGLRPSGTPIDARVAAADRSIEIGDLSPMKGLISHEELHALEPKFREAMALKDYDVNDVAAARRYVEAYVTFFKLAEGGEHSEGHGHAHAHGHGESH